MNHLDTAGGTPLTKNRSRSANLLGHFQAFLSAFTKFGADIHSVFVDHPGLTL
jgi:hypothetical protein